LDEKEEKERLIMQAEREQRQLQRATAPAQHQTTAPDSCTEAEAAMNLVRKSLGKPGFAFSPGHSRCVSPDSTLQLAGSRKKHSPDMYVKARHSQAAAAAKQLVQGALLEQGLGALRFVGDEDA
jgi:hypothetical protein